MTSGEDKLNWTDLPTGRKRSGVLLIVPASQTSEPTAGLSASL